MPMIGGGHTNPSNTTLVSGINAPHLSASSSINQAPYPSTQTRLSGGAGVPINGGAGSAQGAYPS